MHIFFSMTGELDRKNIYDRYKNFLIHVCKKTINCLVFSDLERTWLPVVVPKMWPGVTFVRPL